MRFFRASTFQVWALTTLLAIDKDLEKLPPRSRQNFNHTIHNTAPAAQAIDKDDQGCNDIRVVITTKWRRYLIYVQPQ